MRRILITAGLALAVAVPAVSADAASCGSRKTTGTVIGAVGGGLLGNAITDNAGGTVLGAVGGGLVGREIGKSGCRRTYRSAAVRRSSSRPISYASSGQACRYETRSFYDERGQLVYAPTRVCN